MPIISTFFGIIIRMYFGDHNPPHFHVEFQGEKATFDLEGRLFAGTFPHVRDWARRHRLLHCFLELEQIPSTSVKHYLRKATSLSTG